MDLSSTYLGLQLPHPLMVGASPMADNLDMVRRFEDGGAAAIVMRSLFEEQINAEALATHYATETHAESFGEALSYFPDPQEFVLGPDEYLEQLRQVKAAVGIPVIASLNGITLGGWLDHARHLEQAGAVALELNLYDVPMDPDETADGLERRQVEMVAAVKKAISIPVAVKLSRIYTSLANFVRSLITAGADGIVLFNRFYQPDINIEELELISRLDLSQSVELRLRLRWLAILSGRIKASYAVTGGVHTVEDAIKAIMCGAHALQLVSAVYLNGPEHLGKLRDELARWLEEKEYQSLHQMQGSMNLERCPDPKLLYRSNYIHLLQTWEPQ